MQRLDRDNFILYAMKMYSGTSSGLEDFYEDINRIKYIKRLLIKYKKNNDLKERLILNHIIILQNVFGAEACSRILFYKLHRELHSYLKSFLVYLQYLPKYVPEVDINKINTDHRIDKILKELK
jgi:hypothetical protein